MTYSVKNKQINIKFRRSISTLFSVSFGYYIIYTCKVTNWEFMTLKFFFAFVLFTAAFNANAQDVIYWSGSSSNSEWDWGSGCNANDGGNWYWSTSGTGTRQRPDCNGSFNIIHFDNGVNTTMNLNSGSDFSVSQLLFQTGTSDRIINTNAGRKLTFANNNGNCKIENNAASTTHTFNVGIFVNSGGNHMEINPVNGSLTFNSSIENNSDNAINIFGTQQVNFSADISGTSGVTINNTATVVYSGTSKTYSGTTTINAGAKLKISSNQTLGNLALNGGTLQIDSGATLTITGTYTATAGTIDNKGTIKFAGGSVTFPGNATVNNGVANTLASLEAASTGIVTLNSLLNITNSITVSLGTLKLGTNNLHLTNSVLNIAAGATFDNGGENQIINGGGSINIDGTFITRDAQGFVGTNSAIPTITPTLNSGSTIEYGLNGDQIVQGGTAPDYKNITFSGSGTKTLVSGNAVSGTITVSGSTIFNAGNFTFGNLGNNITMTGTSIYRLGGSGTKPTATGTYSLGPSTSFDFTGTSATDIRLSAPTITYANIIVSGTNISNSGTATGIRFQTGGTFIVKNGATFKLNTTAGFSGATNTAISTTNGGPTITLEAGSTIEYAKAGNQTITPFTPAYSNLTISGSGIKTASATILNIGNDLNIKASQLTINTGQAFVVANKVNNTGGTFIIESNGSLIQVNNNVTNTGNITYKREVPIINSSDYTYWSSPVLNQNLQAFSPNTPSNKFYSFNATAIPEDWKQEEPSSTAMNPGVGYCIYGPQTSMPPTFFLASFTGVPNNGTIQTPITFNGAVDGTSNLIGNPYPSALDADKFLTLNSGVIEGTLYFWTHNTPITNGQYNVNDYASYNKTGGINTYPDVTAASSNPGNNSIPDGKIAAGQAFFATCTASGNVEFNNGMRFDLNDNVMDNSQFFKTRNPKTKTTNPIEKNRIWINLTNSEGIFKQTLIGYITDATNSYDRLYDGESFDANEFADFYSLSQDKNLVIQGRALPFDENDAVALGFRTTIGGDFSITINHADGLLTNQDVFMEDKLTNTLFDLRSGAYTFTTKSGTFNDRFVLRYTNKILKNIDLEKPENQILVSNKNKQIKVNSIAETIDKVIVYDLSGRQLFKKHGVNSNEISIPDLTSNQQTILIKVSLQNGKQVSKKVVY